MDGGLVCMKYAIFALHAELAGNNTMEACLFVSCAKISIRIGRVPSLRGAV